MIIEELIAIDSITSEKGLKIGKNKNTDSLKGIRMRLSADILKRDQLLLPEGSKDN